MKRATPKLKAAAIRRPLVNWYDRAHRDLPWRNTRDPYRIWISEIMLQQTRVHAVIPYYENFLSRFPNVHALAEAQEQDLLASWSGLGYYSRARNLKKAAGVIVEKCGGSFPRSSDEALELPGVGAYTAAAVLSIAYGLALPVLDGNVARVLSRLFAISADLRTPHGRQRLLQHASLALSRRRPGDFNQAMMELGAVICLPRQPDCGACPLRNKCRAFAMNQTDRFPPIRRKQAIQSRQFTAAIILDAERRCLLQRRPASEQWMPGFWELPMIEHMAAPAAAEAAPVTTIFNGIRLDGYLGNIRHTITTNKLHIAIHRARLARPVRRAAEKWVSIGHMSGLPVTTVTRKALRLVVI